MSSTKAYAAFAADTPLKATTIQRRDVGEYDVEINIDFCGVCHTDIHIVRGQWGPRSYPLVPGHEIVGVVAHVGTAVKHFRTGDRVGVGCMVNSCGKCSSCRLGEEQYCLDGLVGTYGDVDVDGTITNGGYAQNIVVNENFVLRIPRGLDSAQAAPLLCAGITMYSPLRRWGAGPGKKIAILGMGGVGHLGVKLAAAMGAEVTVLSRSQGKQEDGLAFGAAGYFTTDDPATFATLAGRFDLILNTVSAEVDLDAYMSLLRPGGVFVNVGVPEAPLSINAFSLIGGRKALAGSLFGGIPETQEMLQFCEDHSIGAEVEVIPAGQINEAYERVLDADVRYRFVIDNATMR